MSNEEQALLRISFDEYLKDPTRDYQRLFEIDFSKTMNVEHAVSLNSGTSALHLALMVAGVKPGDEVLTSSFSFAATANAISYLGAKPVFIDSEPLTWNMNPELLEQELNSCQKRNKMPSAVLAVNILGQCADYNAIEKTCANNDIPLIEDAAESLGAKYDEKNAGTFGQISCFSFNNNKSVSTCGGGMVTTKNKNWAEKIKYLSTQARQNVAHYEHTEVGYNYQLNKLVANIGRGQLNILDQLVAKRRRNFEAYSEALGDVAGIEMMPEADKHFHSRWLTCILVNPQIHGETSEAIRKRLAINGIESRRAWKPLHLQPAFSSCRMVRGDVSEQLFNQGLCLPSGSNLNQDDIGRIIKTILAKK